MPGEAVSSYDGLDSEEKVVATEEEVRRLFSPFPLFNVPCLFAEMQVFTAVRRAHQQGHVDDAGVPDGIDTETLAREMEALLSLAPCATPLQDGEGVLTMGIRASFSLAPDAAGAEVPV